MIAQLLCAATHAELCRPVGELVSLVERHRQQDASLLTEVASQALPAVRELVRRRAGAACASTVDTSAVTCAYCKHLLNSMSILDAESLQVAI